VQIDGFFSQIPYKCHQNRVASLEDSRFEPGLLPGWRGGHRSRRLRYMYSRRRVYSAHIRQSRPNLAFTRAIWRGKSCTPMKLSPFRSTVLGWLEQREKVRLKCNLYRRDPVRFRAKRQHLERMYGLLPERQGQYLALNVSCVPCSLVSGTA